MNITDFIIGYKTGAAKGGSESGGGENRVDYTLDAAGQVTAAKLYGFTTIPDYFFNAFSSMLSVDLSECPNLTAVGKYAFQSCRALQSIYLPNSVKTIGNFAFYGCSALSRISMPDSLTEIGNWAFRDCTGVSGTIYLPYSLAKIGQYAFYNCSALTGIVFSDDTTWYYTTNSSYTGGNKITVPFKDVNADRLTNGYSSYYWYKL